MTSKKIPAPSIRTPEQMRLALKRKTRMFYDIQQLRMQMGGRLGAQAPGASVQLHPDDLAELQARTDQLEEAELLAKKDLENHLKLVPFYSQVIVPGRKGKYKGLGPLMSACILATFDIEKMDTPSKMWAYCGLAPWPCMRCKKCGVDVMPAKMSARTDRVGPDPEKPKKYLDPGSWLEGPFTHPARKDCPLSKQVMDPKDLYMSGRAMRPVPGFQLGYNAWLRAKLVGVLASVLLKIGSPYKKQYDAYRVRKKTDPNTTWWKDAHAHTAGMRYMVKMLLLDLWKDWRAFEGLPVVPSYHEQRRGYEHQTHAPIAQPIENKLDPVLLAEIESELRDAAAP